MFASLISISRQELFQSYRAIELLSYRAIGPFALICHTREQPRVSTMKLTVDRKCDKHSHMDRCSWTWRLKCRRLVVSGWAEAGQSRYWKRKTSRLTSWHRTFSCRIWNQEVIKNQLGQMLKLCQPVSQLYQWLNWREGVRKVDWVLKFESCLERKLMKMTLQCKF